MGTFAGILQKDGVRVPDAKKEEFQRRIEKLFQAGGMMELKVVQLCDKQTRVLKKASMQNANMNFYYNYFEDDCWENAGFCAERGGVWSNKIGWSDFHHVVVAAYVLQSLYLDGTAVPRVNGEFVTSRVYTGWINYLFHENYPQKKNDPWQLFEALHNQRATDLGEYDWKGLVQDTDGLIGYYEVRAVLEGTAALDKEFEQLAERVPTKEDRRKDGSGLNFYGCAGQFKEAVRCYHKKSALSRDEQLSMIMGILRSYYAQESISFDAAYRRDDAYDSKYGEECDNKYNDEYDNEYLKAVFRFAVLTDAPVYVIKILAETYRVHFWKLWQQVKDVAKRKPCQEAQEDSPKVSPVSTEQFFGITADDLILFWGDDENIRFSKGLEKWFADLRKQYEMIVGQEFTVDNPLHWILDLMEYADKNYYCVYTFADFFEETLEHLNDKRFFALWKIYDGMLHDPEMEKAGSVIFVPDGPEYEQIGLYDPDARSRRRLKGSWSILDSKDKNNEARVTFRRYMALLENRNLRKEVFGF
ncbi:MAG: hypothetical protein K2N41_09635 [Lachnospiraceae bacterium]|nr:hypothetical protein [Lachnospiraceae bacterium]MDE7239954.1 hypothetical protein [Lachnospiraceae bacterium]